ncbi:putative mate efflux family protein [Botrytis fragariae]|uniref:Putative mate efflux family protein n=1 Tax=Botrytis fragariae TaxID=1964551 RepID=A0A8H6EHG2_9HELO|nr:putative mate efflux family protein [Botrytis fragariae]KAF5872474.1 putative mate efflux family protein [Botrytis fragariae]
MSSSFPVPIKSSDEGHLRDSISRSPFSTSFISSSPIAQESLARDLAEYPADEVEAPEHIECTSSGDESSEASTIRQSEAQHSMTHSYRRPSFVAFGGTRPAVTPQFKETAWLTKKERHETRNEERSLLRDNHLAPPKHPEPAKRSAFNRLYRKLFSTKIPKPMGDEEAGAPSETSALLPNGQHESARSRHERLNRQWEEAVAAGKIKTTWQREAKTLLRYSSPLVVTFVLQYSLTVASIFTVGHLGKVELGAVSLASMTANITGYAIYQGLATSLDTLCAQAYGSGRKGLVGLQLQRMVWFLWVLTIPIGIVWLSAEKILETIVPEKRSAELAGLYLRVLLLGAPGFALFEGAKRFVQAQGLFSATTYVLLICAPLNAFMNWLFVWQFEWGFIGAPIAVAVTDNLLPLFLFLYVRFVDGKECWDGFTWRAFHNWGPMIKLALPGLVMVLAEYLAFEVLTLASSYFSVTHLAAQSVLTTMTALTFQIPFSISIAASTRVANLIGATLSDAAKTSSKVAIYGACIVGLFNFTLISSLRNIVPRLFTDDIDVINIVASVLPLCAAFQLFDALAANCNGLLRGLGRQEIGGYVNLFCYYVLAMPISFGTAFGLGWQLEGLWLGVALALGLVAAIEGWFLLRTDWARAVEAAQDRNAAG